jgi:hypothetical protein
VNKWDSKERNMPVASRELRASPDSAIALICDPWLVCSPVCA